jgi:geranylgeranyl reductase family protein
VPETGGSPGSVLIIGAGPSGTAAAIELCRAGHQVTIVDKATFPRDKCCGDGLTSGALRHLDHLGVHPSSVASWKPVTDVRITRPSGAEMHFPLPTGPGQFAATATRMDLDAALVDQAIAAGADVRQGVTFEGIELYDDRAVVTTDDGVTTADWVIAADGMWSPTRKALGLAPDGYRGEWHAFRQYFSNVSERAANELFVWFEPEILPGYVWCFPLPDGRANVGFGVLRSTHRTQEMAGLWRDLLTRPHIAEIIGANAEPEGTHKAWPIPARVGELPLTAHRLFFVGDATGACDPMTGEGIGQALQTGMGAAQAIIEAASPAEAASLYEASTEAELAVDMRFASTLGNVLKTRVGAEWSLRTAGMTGWTSRNFARWLFEDYPRAVLGTPGRWRKDLFTQPGAYS